MSSAYNQPNPGRISPAYSVGSQGYSPTSPGYNAATAGGYGMGATVGQSMQYSPVAAAASAHSGASGSGYSPQQAAYNPGASFMPSSPAYNPASQPKNTKGKESPIDDED